MPRAHMCIHPHTHTHTHTNTLVRVRAAACAAANNGGCGDNGNCTIEATGKVCTCKPGWSGTDCTTCEPGVSVHAVCLHCNLLL